MSLQPHLRAIGGLASKLARAGKGCPVRVDKCFERRRRPTTNRFAEVVRAGEDPVLVVDGDLAQVLDNERIARPAVWCLFKLSVQRSGVVSGRRLLPSVGHHLEHGLNAHLLVLDFYSEHAAENIGDPLVGELYRTVQRVSLAAVRTGVFQNPHDNAGLVLSGNWCMTAGAQPHVEQPGTDHGREIQHALCEIRWPQVDDREARPVEDTLGYPVLLCGMTLCVLAGGDLRHVHDAVDAGLLGGLDEVGSSLNDPGADGVAKVSPCDASKRRSDVIQVEKITEHDFGTEPLEPLRPVVLSMGQGSDMVPAGQHLLNGCPASVPGRSGDQKCSPTHGYLLNKLDVVSHLSYSVLK